MREAPLAELARCGVELLRREDPTLYDLLEREYRRQAGVLAMVAASSIADPSVLSCEGMPTANVTTEGLPGARFHAGCEVVDDIERLAIARARAAFAAQYANVQPHSGTSANAIVLFSLLRPGDRILGQTLATGGHLSHGARVSITGRYFEAIGYGVTPEGYIDHDEVRRLAEAHRPRVIICGASAYPRQVDARAFRAIADQVGAFLLADISHVSGLVVGGVHPSPIDEAHVTTTSTYKQLGGPRGGLILMGQDAGSPAPDGRGTLADFMDRAVFPFFQGTPNLSTIAAKARALALAADPEFRRLAQRIVGNARRLAAELGQRDHRVLTGGTDTHMVLLDVLGRGVTGVVAERALEACGIVVNRNRIPGDRTPADVTGGLRLGTNSVSARGMGESDMATCSELIDHVLRRIDRRGEREGDLPADVVRTVRERVAELCRRFPLPRYPAGAAGDG